MSKGLYYCSLCKAHFYDHEATAMHIKDKHRGKGEVLRHPTKRELLVRDKAQRDRIEKLEAEVAALKESLRDKVILGDLETTSQRVVYDADGNEVIETWYFGEKKYVGGPYD